MGERVKHKIISGGLGISEGGGMALLSDIQNIQLFAMSLPNKKAFFLLQTSITFVQMHKYDIFKQKILRLSYFSVQCVVFSSQSAVVSF